MSDDYRHHRLVRLVVIVLFVMVVLLFQVSIAHFIRNKIHISSYINFPLLVKIALILYMIVTNTFFLYILVKVFNTGVVNCCFDKLRGCDCAVVQFFRKGLMTVVHAIIGFKKDFWSETEENDSLVRTFGVMLKESERRIISKLTTDSTDSDKFTDLCSDESVQSSEDFFGK